MMSGLRKHRARPLRPDGWEGQKEWWERGGLRHLGYRLGLVWAFPLRQRRAGALSRNLSDHSGRARKELFGVQSVCLGK